MTLYIITITEAMSSATMAEPSASFDVEAFVLMHGAVHPTKLGPSEQTPDCYKYELTGNSLPHNTELCAPKILGKSYHSTNTIEFINTLRIKWDKPHLPGQSFSDFCLSELETFERTQVGLMEQEMEDSHFMKCMEGSNTNKRRNRMLVLEGAIVAKTRIEWDRHKCSIAEKSYYVISGDSFKNCIMFFCNGIEPPKTLQQLRVTTLIYEITLWVSYNKETKLFKITFDRHRKYEFSFEDLNDIIRIVVSSFTGGLDFNLTLFDFSCCVALFQDEACLRDLTPQLLPSTMLSNSGVDNPTLIYRTIREDIQREWKSQKKRSNIADGDTQYLIPDSPSPSPDRPPSSLVVNLNRCVGSFADFEPISRFESRRSNSGARSEIADGGGRSRLIKKVSRKRITRRQRHTNRRLRVKGSNRRSRRKQK